MIYLTLIIFVFTIIANALGNFGIISGFTIKDISDKYVNLFTPANYTFLIWMVIYILLLLFTLYSVNIIKNENNKSEEKIFNSINIFYLLNLVLNIMWVISWTFDKIYLSLFLMLLIFFVLYKINENIGKFKLNSRQIKFIKWPFSLYFGWITAATLANIMAVFIKLGLNAFSSFGKLVTIIITILGFVIFIMMYYKNRDLVFLAGILWAYIGILINQMVVHSFNYKIVTLVTFVIVALLSYLLVKDFKKYFYKIRLK